MTHKLILGSVSIVFFLIILLSVALYLRRRRSIIRESDIKDHKPRFGRGEDFITFLGAEHLTIHTILDAPGEVIGKSSYGTIYKATMDQRNCFRALRFMRPACTGAEKDVAFMIRTLGLIRHRNLVPLEAYYAGSRGERLLVHPFYSHGNLAQFIKIGKNGSQNWDIICQISIAIVRGLDHLHSSGFHSSIVHGNLKSKNILLDQNLQPHVSDFALYRLLNPPSAHRMLESLTIEGYKSPELHKMGDAALETDVYSLGVILLEMVTGKEAVSERGSCVVPVRYLPEIIRNAILNHGVRDLVRPGMVLGGGNDGEECVRRFFRIAIDCCSPSAALRPGIKQVLRRLQEIRR